MKPQTEQDACDGPVTAQTVSSQLMRTATAEAWADTLAREINERRRAECMARIQRDAVQLAIDLLVREPDIAGFFRVFIKTLVEESESHGCGVWLLNGHESGEPAVPSCDLWMALVEDRFYTRGGGDGNALALPSESMSAHLLAYRPGWTEIVQYTGDDARLPEPVRRFNAANGIDTVLVAPLVLPTRNLGWFALSCGRVPLCDGGAWHRALLDAMARQATLALHQSQLAEQSRSEARRQAVLEERNRLARDIHDTLAQGFAAILMQLQGAQRSAAALPPAVARSLETAVDLARTHMVEARRSVCALRPQEPFEDVAAALERLVGAGAARHRHPHRAHASSTCRRSPAAPIARSLASPRKRCRTPSGTRARAASRCTPRASARSASGCRWPTTGVALPANGGKQDSA